MRMLVAYRTEWLRGHAMVVILGALVGCSSGPEPTGDPTATALPPASETSTPVVNSAQTRNATLSSTESVAVVPAGNPATEAAATPGIPVTTRRSSSGLPEPLPGYLSWPQVDDAAVATAAPQTIPATTGSAYQTYLFIPGSVDFAATSVSAQLGAGATILREVKASRQDFVSEIHVLQMQGDRWISQVFTRPTATAAFESAAGGSEQRAALEALAALEKITLAQ